jgi:hypothetical protein
MSVTFPAPTVALTANAACDLCPLYAPPAPPSSQTLPPVRFGGAVVASLAIGAGFWTGVAYLVATLL